MAEEIKAWLSLISLAVALAGILYTWITARAKNNSSEITGIKDAQKHHDRRIQAIESELLHLPAKDDVHKMNIEIAQMQGAIATISAQVASMNLGMGRLEQFLLQKEKDK